jgi:hypothetical protein
MVSRQDQEKALLSLGLTGVLDTNQPNPYKKDRDMLNAMPLLAIPVILYNIVAFTAMISGADSGGAYAAMTSPWFQIPMPSHGTVWNVSVGDVILLGGLVCLFFELIKSTASDQLAIINHSLSLVVFLVALIEFLLIPTFATSTFFLLSMMALMDVVAGFIVTIISARKDIEIGPGR